MNWLRALILVTAGFCVVPLQGRSETLAESFEKIWRAARENIYPEDRRAYFSDERHAH